MSDRNFGILFQILASEQQILQRADQKAFTLLSILGVFMVFFIVHYTKIPPNYFVIFMIIIYFVAALISILSLLLVISPRIKNTEVPDEKTKKLINPTFFAGIVQFKSAEEYARYLNTILDNNEEIYNVFSNSVYSIGQINSYKNKYLKRGIISFVTAVTFELIIIVSMYVNLALGQI